MKSKGKHAVTNSNLRHCGVSTSGSSSLLRGNTSLQCANDESQGTLDVYLLTVFKHKMFLWIYYLVIYVFRCCRLMLQVAELGFCFKLFISCKGPSVSDRDSSIFIMLTRPFHTFTIINHIVRMFCLRAPRLTGGGGGL